MARDRPEDVDRSVHQIHQRRLLLCSTSPRPARYATARLDGISMVHIATVNRFPAAGLAGSTLWVGKMPGHVGLPMISRCYTLRSPIKTWARGAGTTYLVLNIVQTRRRRLPYIFSFTEQLLVLQSGTPIARAADSSGMFFWTRQQLARAVGRRALTWLALLSLPTRLVNGFTDADNEPHAHARYASRQHVGRRRL